MDQQFLPLPSLVWLCINAVCRSPDQLHLLPVRLNYRNELSDLDLLDLDPRLWATLVQIYDRLPAKLSTYRVPLNDVHLPLLQDIPCTPRFSMLTVLVHPSLDDANVVQLKFLHLLTALDASNSALTSYGLKALASTLAPRPQRGPWPLRVLSLRNCKSITDHASPYLETFPLLSVIDLRGTRCTSTPSGFNTGGPPLLFHPSTPSESLSYLRETFPDINSSPNAFTILIDSLHHKPSKRTSARPVYHDNTVVTFSSTSNRLRIDNAEAIQRRVQAREDAEQHEKNKAAWIQRQETILANSDPFMTSERSVFMAEPPARRLQPISGPAILPTITRNVVHSRSAATTTSTGTLRARASIPFIGIPNVVPSGPTSPNNAIASTSVLQAQPSTNTRPRDVPSQRLPTRTMRTVTSRSSSTTIIPPPNTSIRPVARSVPTNPQSRSEVFDGRVHAKDPPLQPNSVETAIVRAMINPIDEPFMLYRDPPPWSRLAETLATLHSEEIRRKEAMNTALATRNAEFAEIDRSGHKMVAAKRQLQNLVARRSEMHETFGLAKSQSRPAPQKEATNPFKRREVTASSSNKCLVPISRVPTPVFTQELLDVSAKENEKAKAEDSFDLLVKKQRRSSMPLAGTAKRRARPSEPVKTSGSFDWKKWGKGGS